MNFMTSDRTSRGLFQTNVPQVYYKSEQLAVVGGVKRRC